MRPFQPFAVAVAFSACSGAEPERAPPPPRATESVEPQALVVAGGEISLVTTKDGDTEVPAKFDKVSGELQFADGLHQQGLTGLVDVELASWSTGLDERDGNVRGTFFKVEESPTARFTLGAFDGMPEGGMAVGEEVDGTATGRVTLMGVDSDVVAKVKLRRSGETDYHVDSAEPLVLSIEAFGAEERLLELMTKCDHKSVDDAVRLTFSFALGAPEAPDADPGSTGKATTHRPPQRAGGSSTSSSGSKTHERR